MARAPADTIDFTARIPRELHERFLARFPQYGSNTWFLKTMLEKFLDEVEASPAAEDLMNKSLFGFLEDRARV